jgi:hypothetical protein
MSKYEAINEKCVCGCSETETAIQDGVILNFCVRCHRIRYKSWM